MEGLSKVTFEAALALAALGLPCVLAPERTRAFLERFPRCRPWAWALTAAGMAWSGWLLHQTPLGRFEGAKAYLPVLAPVVTVLLCVFMDELLAPRALGGLLALVPAPLLAAARWHPSPLRLVVTVFAYALAIAGIVLILSPYRFRKAAETFARTPRACRTAGMAGLALAAVFAVLALAVY